MKNLSVSLSLIIVCAASAAADEVHLKDGKILTGKVVREGKRIMVVDRDRKLAVPVSKIARDEQGEPKIVSKPSFMDEYETRLEKLPVEDAEAIYEFGLWLEENDWKSRAQRVFEEVLEVDPDHRGARRALGYKLYEGSWVSPEELNVKKGLVEFEGRWYTKHDLAELKQEIEKNEQLRQAITRRRQVNAKVNGIVKKFATFQKPKRDKAYNELYTYAEQLNSPELRKFADDVKAYYDAEISRLCHQMRSRTQINATRTRLKRPIDTFETTLGAATLGVIAAQNPVKIQLPEVEIAQVQTTADIPAGCG